MKGRKSEVGDTRVSKNGYHYTKTSTGWRLTHQIIAEERLGRGLGKTERIRFKDNDRKNLDPNNIEVFVTREKSIASQIASVEAKIDQLVSQLDDLRAEEEATKVFRAR